MGISTFIGDNETAVGKLNPTADSNRGPWDTSLSIFDAPNLQNQVHERSDADNDGFLIAKQQFSNRFLVNL
ncbi:hypothetical protein V6N12_010985 [Hibiscus sabdariffa]|uniref:Uncharacterized protein n=1 Tax=Hibiscus sabdariffa TaxID=183260 RepID=A0ABR2EQJ0_9ROSI